MSEERVFTSSEQHAESEAIERCEPPAVREEGQLTEAEWRQEETRVNHWLQQEEHKESELDTYAAANVVVRAVLQNTREETTVVIPTGTPTAEVGASPHTGTDAGVVVATITPATRKRKGPPQTLEEILEVYAPPENESADATTKRKRNMQNAIHRMKKRQQRQRTDRSETSGLLEQCDPEPVAQLNVLHTTTALFRQLHVADVTEGFDNTSISASQAKRDRARLQKAARRANMTDAEKEEVRRRDAAAKAKKRKELSEAGLNLERSRHAVRVAEARDQRSEEETQRDRQQVAVNNAEQRAGETQGERDTRRESDRQRHRERRVNLTDGQRASANQRNAQQHRVHRSNPRLRGIGLATYDDFQENLAVVGPNTVNGRHSLPHMDHVCQYCQAISWKPRNSRSKMQCCQNGRVIPEPFIIPEDIKAFFRDPVFLKNIRKYNTAFQFTSLGAKVDERLASDEAGVYTFQISGRMYHNIGTLLSARDDARLMFAQVYIHDGDMEAQLLQRTSAHPLFQLDSAIVARLQAYIVAHNPYAQAFMMAGERLRAQPSGCFCVEE